MAKDVADALGTAIGKVAREAAKNVQANASRKSGGNLVGRVTNAVSDRVDGALSGRKGVAAGAGLATLVPLAAKGAGKLVRGIGGDGAGPVEKVSEVGGKAAKSMRPGRGRKDDKKSQGMPGVGKGRRMPFQWDIDIGVPLETVYNQWTQFEDWPKFMHRLQSVSQEDDTHVKFKTKIWGISREFTAEIVEQRPDERIKWKVTEGLTHQGVVTFHELAPRLTRVEVSFDVEPGGLIEKAARGMRHVKRAARADLARFKAYVLMEDDETGSWRGEVEEGEVKRRSSRSSSSRSSTKRSSSNGRSRSSSSGRKRSGSSSSQSRSRSGGTSKSQSGGTSRSSSSGSTSRSRSTSSGQSRSTTKRSSSGGRKQSSSSSNGRSSSSRSRGSSSNGRSSSTQAKKRTGTRS
jgi:uncharacterized membrane protein